MHIKELLALPLPSCSIPREMYWHELTLRLCLPLRLARNPRTMHIRPADFSDEISFQGSLCDE